MESLEENKNSHDELIKKIFFNQNGKIKKNNYLRYKKYPNIINYLGDRYNDYDNLKEVIYRIYFNMDERPVCEICGNRVKYSNVTILFSHACCKTHAYELNRIKRIKTWENKYGVGCKCPTQSHIIKQKIKDTLIKHYNVDNPAKSKIIKEKIRETCLEKYGVDWGSKSFSAKLKSKETCLKKYGTEYYLNSEDCKEKTRNFYIKKYGVNTLNCSSIEEIYNRKRITWYQHYGVDHPFKSDIVKEKRKNTWIKKYGVEWIASSNEIRQKIINTNLIKYGYITPSKNLDVREKLRITWNKEETKEKQYATKRKNHTFNTSKPEEELFLYVKSKFPSVKRQYKDKERYPYNCDFYIPELDYFIELQGYYTHNTHPYDPTSNEDLKLVEKYKVKYGPKCQAITIWTIKDVEKRNCAKEHNLNFKEVWSLDEGKHFVDSLYNKMST